MDSSALKRLLRMQLRNSSYILVVSTWLAALVWIAFGFFRIRPGGQFSPAVPEFFGSGLLFWIPLWTWPHHPQQRGKINHLATMASLPVDRVTLAVCRYLLPVVLQVVLGVLMVLSWIVDARHTADANLIVLLTNGACLGLAVRALGLLITDLFPRVSFSLGALLWVGLMGMRGRTDAIFDALAARQYLPSIVVASAVIIATEVLVFSRRTSLV